MSFTTDRVYDDVVRFYFADTPVIGEKVWERYTQYVQPWMSQVNTFEDFLEMYIEKPGSLQNLSAVTSVPSGIYSGYLDTYFRYRSSSEQLNIWKAFLASKGYPNGTSSSPTEEELASKALQDEFGAFVYNIRTIEANNIESLKTFVRQYNAYGFDRATLGLEDVTTIPGGFYADYIKAFFSGRSTIEPLDIWRSFLVSIGYPRKDSLTGITILVPSAEELESSAMKAAFTRHVAALREKELNFSAQTSESPHQIATDTILYDLMGSLRSMLNTTEILVRNQANALIVSGKVQQEYTTMLSRVPNLTAGKAQNITVPAEANLISKNWELSNFLFGYNKISLQDIVEWGVENAFEKRGSVVSYEQPTGCFFRFELETGSSSTAKFKVTFNYDGLDKTEEFSLVDQEGADKGRFISRAECYTLAGDALKTIFAAHVSTVEKLALVAGIPGRYLSDTSKEDLDARTEQTALLQQYIDHIRALRDAAKATSQLMQTSASVTKESINQHTALWTSILEMIDSVIHSIFQKK